MGIETVGTPGLWIGFTLFILILLVLDLGVFHRKAHEVSIREALTNGPQPSRRGYLVKQKGENPS